MRDRDARTGRGPGEEFTAWRPSGPGAIELDLRVGDHTVVVWTGYHGRASEVAREYATSAPAGAVSGSSVAPSPAAIAAAASCRCC